MINLDDVKQMLGQTSGETFSLYLDVDLGKQENQSSQPAWRISLKNAIRDAEQQHKDAASWQPIKARVEAFFNGYMPDAKGFAGFFTADSEQIYELPVPVDPAWAFGMALVAPLLWAIDEYEPYLIVMVDQEKAELLTAYLGVAQIEDTLESDIQAYDFQQKTLMPSASALAGGYGLTQGSNREAYRDMINAHIARFHREVVDQVENLHKQQPHVRIVIGGAEQAAYTVRDMLPEYLREMLVAVIPMPMRLSESEILKQITPAALNYERDYEMNLVNQVIDFAKSGGRGALGRKDVEEALTMQRVETLLLPWSAGDEADATALSARTFASGGAVELIHGAAADRLKQEGDVAARLYYVL